MFQVEIKSIYHVPTGGAKVVKSLEKEVLTFNPDDKKIKFLEMDNLALGESNLHDLRSAVYQNDEST